MKPGHLPILLHGSVHCWAFRWWTGVSTGTWLFWLFWLLSIRTSLNFLANLSYSSSSVRSDHRSRPLFHIRAAVLKALWPSHNLVLLKLAQILLTSTLRTKFSLSPKYIPYTNLRHGDGRIRYSNVQVMECSQYAEKRCCWLGISTLCSWGLHKHILGSVLLRRHRDGMHHIAILCLIYELLLSL